MVNDVHFVLVNRLHDSHVMFDGQKGGRHEQHGLTNAKTLAERLQSERYTVRWVLFERAPIAEDPLNYMDENTIERVRDFVRATKIQYKPTFTISLAIPGKTSDCTHCTRKTRKGQSWKKGEVCLLVDDDWPVATKDYVHLNSDCLQWLMCMAEAAEGCKVHHTFYQEAPKCSEEVTGKTRDEAMSVLLKFWKNSGMLEGYPSRIDDNLEPVA